MSPGRQLAALAVLLAPAAATAHLLAPRTDLDALAAGASLVVRGEIVAGASRPAGVAGSVATLAIERVLRGELSEQTVTFLAEDDHGGGYEVGDRPLLFLAPRASAAVGEPRFRTTAARGDCPLVPDPAAAAALDGYFTGVAALPPGDRPALEAVLAAAVVAGPLPLARHAGRRLSELARGGDLAPRTLETLLAAPLASRAPEPEVCGGIAALCATAGATPAALAALLGATDLDCRRAVAAGLVAVAGESEVANALASVVAQPDEAAGLAAAVSLGRAGDARGLELLLAAARDRRVPLRLEAVEPLAQLSCVGVGQAGSALDALAVDRDRGVGLAAAGARAVTCARRGAAPPAPLQGLSLPGLVAGVVAVALLLGLRFLARRRGGAAGR